MLYIVYWGVTAVLCSGLAGVLAGLKNRDYSFWMAWCFVVPPLVLVLLVLPRHMGTRPRRRTLDEEDRAST